MSNFKIKWMHGCNFYMWQSWVETKHDPITYSNHVILRLKHCSARLALRVGLIFTTYTCQVFIYIYTTCTIPAHNDSSMLRYFKCNTIEIRDCHVSFYYPGYFYNSIFLFPCHAISHDITWLHGILATTMCFNRSSAFKRRVTWYFVCEETQCYCGNGHFVSVHIAVIAR